MESDRFRGNLNEMRAVEEERGSKKTDVDRKAAAAGAVRAIFSGRPLRVKKFRVRFDVRACVVPSKRVKKVSRAF